jgi:hypothetical protein
MRKKILDERAEEEEQAEGGNDEESRCQMLDVRC